MKRVFPIIVLLITLSVTGILFMQWSWIQNAINVKKEQYDNSFSSAVTKMKGNILDDFLKKLNPGYIPNERGKQFLLDKNFTANYFVDEELDALISSALKANDIRQPYEYAITNIFGNPIKSSKGWLPAYLTTSRHIALTSEEANAVEVLHVRVSEPKNYIVGQMGWMIVASIILTIIVISAFALTVRTLFAQKKLSEIKSDFINNMTHELKTPLATISLAVDSLVNKKVIGVPEQIMYYSGMIKAENKRMNEQVETILQAAQIERNEVQLNLIPMHAHDVIKSVADTAQLQIAEKQGSLSLRLNATKTRVLVDQVHFSNIIFNLLDNAIKYSDAPPEIEISTHSNGNKLFIKVRDNGIGMTRETMSRVFEKFYRAHTGNLHNVKGFGLGLSYVKAMVEAMKGSIRAESAVGKGSAFTVVLPVS